MNKILSDLRLYFSWVQMIIILLIGFVISSGYLYLTTENKLVSIVLGLVSSFLILYFMFYIPRKISKEHFYMKELQKYAMNVIFNLKSNMNVPQALESAKKSLDKNIQKDIDQTLEILKEEAELNTEHFKKYLFYRIDIFHQTLKIKYEMGGDVDELFRPIQKDINDEIVYRDKLYRGKKGVKNLLIMMVCIALSIPLLLKFIPSIFGNNVYDIFLSAGTVSTIAVSTYYILCLFRLCRIHARLADLSLHF